MKPLHKNHLNYQLCIHVGLGNSKPELKKKGCNSHTRIPLSWRKAHLEHCLGTSRSERSPWDQDRTCTNDKIQEHKSPFPFPSLNMEPSYRGSSQSNPTEEFGNNLRDMLWAAADGCVSVLSCKEEENGMRWRCCYGPDCPCLSVSVRLSVSGKCCCSSWIDRDGRESGRFCVNNYPFSCICSLAFGTDVTLPVWLAFDRSNDCSVCVYRALSLTVIPQGNVFAKNISAAITLQTILARSALCFSFKPPKQSRYTRSLVIWSSFCVMSCHPSFE